MEMGKLLQDNVFKSDNRRPGMPRAHGREGSPHCLWSGSPEWQSGQLHSPHNHSKSGRVDGTACLVEDRAQCESVDLAVLRRGSTA